jgi:hypothetical protein
MVGDHPKNAVRSARRESYKAASKTPAARAGNIRDFFGLLARKTKKIATIEEINAAAAEGWAGKK